MHGDKEMGIDYRRSAIILAIVFVFIPTLLLGQGQDIRRVPPAPIQLEQNEKYDGKYTPLKPMNQTFSPAYHRTSADGFFISQVNVSGTGENIVGDAANEPSLAVDPTNPNRMAIGWRQFNTVTNNFRQAGYGYTTNAGHTWTFPGIIEPGVFRSDPVLDADANGNFFFNSLTLDDYGNYSCAVFKSVDGGANWGSKTDARGGDKQWMIADKTESIGKNNFYSFWTYAYSSCSPGFFTRGLLGGLIYENCIEIPSNPYWGTLDVDSNGVLYVGGWGGGDFAVAKSTTARNMETPTTWDTVVTVDLDGYITYGTDPNPGGLAGQTWLAVDKTGNSTSGNVYVLCSVQRKSTTDPLDVMFSRSTDGGLSWSVPVRINDDTSSTAWQWFGTMSVAPNGRIDVVWLDTRDNPGTVLSSLYYSCSVDGGLTWSLNKRLSESFDPHLGWPQQNKMGDYFHMVSDSTGANLAWAATFNGEQDVYFSWIPEDPRIPNLHQFSVDNHWNIISVPVERTSYLKTDLFPTSISNAFYYHDGGYVPEDTLKSNGAYWLKFGSDEIISITGDSIRTQAFSVQEGWNMIGSVSSPIAVSSITSDPSNLTTSDFWEFNQSYFRVDSILPGKGYWVKVRGTGTLYLSSVTTGNITSRIKIASTDEMPPSPPVLTGEKEIPVTPLTFSLKQNYPNPFNPSTTISYQLPARSHVTLRVFDLLGREVAMLVNRIEESGNKSVVFDASRLLSGVYYYRLQAGNFVDTKKLLLLR
ncbi:MAG: T9SS type A sorting domain-containing protein [Ignavibacteriales bacterium]|nr:T9SS type A sorting domain-containing protein [Ignavibacteriales bacterium]